MRFSLILVLLTNTLAQQIGRTQEKHPRLTTFSCTKAGGCVPRNTSVVLDYFWRNVYDIKTGDSCLTPDFGLNKTICPSVEACSKRCALDGANYSESGVKTTTESNSVTLQMYNRIQGKLVQVAPQIYLLDEDEENYVQFQLLDQEISFEVDVSKAPCGLDAAMYLSEMEASGGRSHLNPAGATYGTGYCDSQCSNSWPFISGVANIDSKGVCCNEMDLWEANARANQLTAHPCNVTGVYACSGVECNGRKGVCDRSGCAFQPYSLGARHFYGEGNTVDTTQPFRVVTQFVAGENGHLAQIRRLYVQRGKLIHNAVIRLNHTTFDSMSTDFCEVASEYFSDRGGLPLMGAALKRGMTMVMGIWSDPGGYNNWLDSGDQGPCNKTAGKPSSIKANYPDASVTFANIRWGDVGTTYYA